MKISELQEQLELIKLGHGDLDIYTPDGEEGGGLVHRVNVFYPYKVINGVYQYGLEDFEADPIGVEIK
jgi:hypothetical protein